MLARMLARLGYVHRSAMKRSAVRQSAAVALQHAARREGLKCSMVTAHHLTALALDCAVEEARERTLDHRL